MRRLLPLAALALAVVEARTPGRQQRLSELQRWPLASSPLPGAGMAAPRLRGAGVALPQLLSRSFTVQMPCPQATTTPLPFVPPPPPPPPAELGPLRQIPELTADQLPTLPPLPTAMPAMPSLVPPPPRPPIVYNYQLGHIYAAKDVEGTWQLVRLIDGPNDAGSYKGEALAKVTAGVEPQVASAWPAIKGSAEYLRPTPAPPLGATYAANKLPPQIFLPDPDREGYFRPADPGAAAAPANATSPWTYTIKGGAWPLSWTWQRVPGAGGFAGGITNGTELRLP